MHNSHCGWHRQQYLFWTHYQNPLFIIRWIFMNCSLSTKNYGGWDFSLVKDNLLEMFLSGNPTVKHNCVGIWFFKGWEKNFLRGKPQFSKIFNSVIHLSWNLTIFKMAKELQTNKIGCVIRIGEKNFWLHEHFDDCKTYCADSLILEINFSRRQRWLF